MPTFAIVRNVNTFKVLEKGIYVKRRGTLEEVNKEVLWVSRGTT